MGHQEITLTLERLVKIAFVVGEFPALSETFVLNQITALLERGHEVSIFAEREGDQSTTHRDVDGFGLRQRVRYERMPERALARAMRLPAMCVGTPSARAALNVFRHGLESASLRLAFTANLFQGSPAFDVVHCHFGALGLKAARAQALGVLRGRIVTAFHGEDIVNYPKRFRAGLYAPLFDRGELFLPISDRWNEALVAMGCPAERIRVHRMGVDLRRFKQGTGRSGGPVKILSVGRLVEKKGIAQAIAALSTVAAPFEYVIAGDGPLRCQLEELARQRLPAGSFRFLGAQTQDAIVPLLQSADIFLAPSVTADDGDIEGIPVAIMEAMAAGLAVVATRHSGIPELVAHDRSGLLVDEYDVEGLAIALTALVADPAHRTRLGAAGRAIVAAEYDVAALTDRLVDLYSGIVDRPS